MGDKGKHAVGSRLPPRYTTNGGTPALLKAEVDTLSYHLSLLNKTPERHEIDEISNAPIFTMPVLEYAKSFEEGDRTTPFTHYGLLGGNKAILNRDQSATSDHKNDPRIFFNVAAPSSTFICGSQGSGKSHTLSCLLENCLIQSEAGVLPTPLTGLVFHYDSFISDDGGSPCEAAYLATHSHVKVKILCAPTNLSSMRVSLHHMIL